MNIYRWWVMLSSSGMYAHILLTRAARRKVQESFAWAGYDYSGETGD